MTVPGGALPAAPASRSSASADAPPPRGPALDDARPARRRPRARRAARRALGLARRRSTAASATGSPRCTRRDRDPARVRDAFRAGRRARSAACDSSSRTRRARLFPPVCDARPTPRRPGCSSARRLVGAPRAARPAGAPRRRRPEALRPARARRRAAGLRDLPRSDVWDGRLVESGDGARRRGDRRDAGGDGGDLAFLLDIDWTRRSRRGSCRSTIRCSCCSPSRGACGPASATALWVRLVDVGAALSGRDVRRRRRASSSTFATSSARGTRAAGSSPAARRSARTRAPTSRSTSPTLGSPRTSAASRSRELAQGRPASRSCSRARSSGRTASSATASHPWCPEIF